MSNVCHFFVPPPHKLQAHMISIHCWVNATVCPNQKMVAMLCFAARGFLHACTPSNRMMEHFNLFSINQSIRVWQTDICDQHVHAFIIRHVTWSEPRMTGLNMSPSRVTISHCNARNWLSWVPPGLQFHNVMQETDFMSPSRVTISHCNARNWLSWIYKSQHNLIAHCTMGHRLNAFVPSHSLVWYLIRISSVWLPTSISKIETVGM